MSQDRELGSAAANSKPMSDGLIGDASMRTTTSWASATSGRPSTVINV